MVRDNFIYEKVANSDLLIVIMVSSCVSTNPRVAYQYPLLGSDPSKYTLLIEINKPTKKLSCLAEWQQYKIIGKKQTMGGELIGGATLDEKEVGEGKLYPIDPFFRCSFVFVGANSVRVMRVEKEKIVEDKVVDVKFQKPVVLVKEGIAIVEEDGSKIMFYKDGKAAVYTPGDIFSSLPIFYFDNSFFASTDGKKLLIINFETLNRYDYDLEKIIKENSLPKPKNLKLFGTFEIIGAETCNYLVIRADNWTRDILISEEMKIKVE